MAIAQRNIDTIVEAALMHKYAPLEKKLADNDAQNYIDVRDVLLRDIKEKLRDLPLNWWRSTTRIRVSVGGSVCYVTGIYDFPIPQSHSDKTTYFDARDPLGERIIANANAIEDLRKQKKADEKTLETMIKQAPNIKRLQMAWPEGYPFYSQFLVKPKPANVPAVLVDTVNKALGLPV